VLTLLRIDLQKDGVRVHTQLDEQLAPVSGNAVQLQQVILNLVVNAADAMRSTEPRTLTIQSLATSSGTVLVSIEDSGPGISDDDIPVIFEEFSRLEIHHDKPGAGLGLAIALRVARLLGGDLTARRAEGKGSVFTLWLPLEATDSRRAHKTEYATVAS